MFMPARSLNGDSRANNSLSAMANISSWEERTTTTLSAALVQTSFRVVMLMSTFDCALLLNFWLYTDRPASNVIDGKCNGKGSLNIANPGFDDLQNVKWDTNTGQTWNDVISCIRCTWWAWLARHIMPFKHQSIAQEFFSHLLKMSWGEWGFNWVGHILVLSHSLAQALVHILLQTFYRYWFQLTFICIYPYSCGLCLKFYHVVYARLTKV